MKGKERTKKRNYIFMHFCCFFTLTLFSFCYDPFSCLLMEGKKMHFEIIFGLVFFFFWRFELVKDVKICFLINSINSDKLRWPTDWQLHKLGLRLNWFSLKIVPLTGPSKIWTTKPGLTQYEIVLLDNLYVIQPLNHKASYTVYINEKHIIRPAMYKYITSYI